MALLPVGVYMFFSWLCLCCSFVINLASFFLALSWMQTGHCLRWRWRLGNEPQRSVDLRPRKDSHDRRRLSQQTVGRRKEEPSPLVRRQVRGISSFSRIFVDSIVAFLCFAICKLVYQSKTFWPMKTLQIHIVSS